MLKIKFYGKDFTSYEDANDQLNELKNSIDGEEKARYDVVVYENRREIDAATITIDKEDNRTFRQLIEEAEPKWYIPGTSKGEKYLKDLKPITDEEFDEMMENRRD